jgi:hypothetical protein
MSKVNLTDIAGGYGSTSRLNANNTLIEEGFDNTLSRDGTTPNQMDANLDMNSHRITNITAPQSNTDAARWIDVTSAQSLGAAPSPVGATDKFLVSNGTVAIWREQFPTTSIETTAGATVTNPLLRPGEIGRYLSPAHAVLACKDFNYRLKLDGLEYILTAPLVIDLGVVVDGTGCRSDASKGSRFKNLTVDVPIFTFTGSNPNSQRSKFSDFGISHSAATNYAFAIAVGGYTQLDNIAIKCNSLGRGGVLVGDQLDTTVAESWQCTLNNVRVDDAVQAGIRVNTTGHTVELRNCSPRSAVNGAHGAYINSRNVHIYGGQYGADNTGGRNIYFYNPDTQAHHRGSVNDVVFENVGAGEYAIDIDGATQNFTEIEVNRVGTNLSNNLGTVIRFGRAVNCVLNRPSILAPTGGGLLAEWTANSLDCKVIVDYDAARAPVTVNAAATRAIKEVYGGIPRANVANITTAANLTTILRDGIIDDLTNTNILPADFMAIHNGVAWNYWLIALGDDIASSVTPPTFRGIAIIESNGNPNHFGVVSYDTDAAGAAIALLSSSANLEVTTGALANGGGTDVKLTMSTHTDGKIYLSNRLGSTHNFTIRFLSARYGVT